MYRTDLLYKWDPQRSIPIRNVQRFGGHQWNYGMCEAKEHVQWEHHTRYTKHHNLSCSQFHSELWPSLKHWKPRFLIQRKDRQSLSHLKFSKNNQVIKYGHEEFCSCKNQRWTGICSQRQTLWYFQVWTVQSLYSTCWMTFFNETSQQSHSSWEHQVVIWWCLCKLPRRCVICFRQCCTFA